MIFANFNIYTISIFIIFIIISIFVIIFYYYEYKKTRNLLFFLSVISVVISFIVLSFSIFGIKINKADKSLLIGSNIVFVLDVSKSMNAIDHESTKNNLSRLSLSKKFIGDFVIKNQGNRYALVVFAGESQRILPFTNDSELFLTILSGINENNVSKQGTNLEDALKSGLENFNSLDNSGLIVLLSDGDDEKNINIESLKKLKGEKNIKFLIVGVGSVLGSNIPIGLNPFGDAIYKSYNGQKVVTKLSENNLKMIANSFKGTYFNLNENSKIGKLTNILDDSIKKVFILESESYVDITRYFTMISFVFFTLYLIFLIGYDKNKK